MRKAPATEFSDTNRKRVAVEELIKALQKLPADSFVEINCVGNLLVTAPDTFALGYIDLLVCRDDTAIELKPFQP